MLTLRRGKFQNKETRFHFTMKGKKNNKNKEIWKKEIKDKRKHTRERVQKVKS